MRASAIVKRSEASVQIAKAAANYLGLPQYHADFVETPLPVLCIVMFAISIQFFLMGLLAELLVRTYHESQDKAIYAVREKIGFRNEKES